MKSIWNVASVGHLKRIRDDIPLISTQEEFWDSVSSEVERILPQVTSQKNFRTKHTTVKVRAQIICSVITSGKIGTRRDW